jgi:hypothetical protein
VVEGVTLVVGEPRCGYQLKIISLRELTLGRKTGDGVSFADLALNRKVDVVK